MPVRVTAELIGSAEWLAALKRKTAAVGWATNRAAAESARMVERQIKLTLRTYTHPPGTPTPSPPGSPPALVTGDLMRSVKVRGPLPGRNAHVVRFQIGPTIVYSRIQELGGRVRRHNRGHMGPQVEGAYTRIPARPYVKPSVNAVRASVRRKFRSWWKEALKA